MIGERMLRKAERAGLVRLAAWLGVPNAKRCSTNRLVRRALDRMMTPPLGERQRPTQVGVPCD